MKDRKYNLTWTVLDEVTQSFVMAYVAKHGDMPTAAEFARVHGGSRTTNYFRFERLVAHGILTKVSTESKSRYRLAPETWQTLRSLIADEENERDVQHSAPDSVASPTSLRAATMLGDESNRTAECCSTLQSSDELTIGRYFGSRG